MFDKHIYAMWDDFIPVPPTDYERMTVKTRPSLRTGSPRHNEFVLSAKLFDFISKIKSRCKLVYLMNIEFLLMRKLLKKS